MQAELAIQIIADYSRIVFQIAQFYLYNVVFMFLFLRKGDSAAFDYSARSDCMESVTNAGRSTISDINIQWHSTALTEKQAN